MCDCVCCNDVNTMRIRVQYITISFFHKWGSTHMSTLVADTYAVRSTYRLVLGNLTHLLHLPEYAGIPLRGRFAAFASSKSLSLIRLRSPSLPGIRCRPLQIAVVQNSKRFTIIFISMCMPKACITCHMCMPGEASVRIFSFVQDK